MSSFSNYYIKLNMNSEHGNGGDDELSVKVPVEHDNIYLRAALVLDLFGYVPFLIVPRIPCDRLLLFNDYYSHVKPNSQEKVFVLQTFYNKVLDKFAFCEYYNGARTQNANTGGD